MSKTEIPPNTCRFDGCTKKIKLTDFACKCEKYFCKFHKDPKNIIAIMIIKKIIISKKN